MNELLQNWIAILTGDATLTAIVPATSIMVGAVDITMETQASLLYPQINLHTVSEVQRTVPLHTRDTHIQVDIWSRNSMLEVLTIYERVVTLLSYQVGNQGTAHFFWQRLGGAVDLDETDRRTFHRAMTFVAWSIKP